MGKYRMKYNGSNQGGMSHEPNGLLRIPPELQNEFKTYFIIYWGSVLLCVLFICIGYFVDKNMKSTGTALSISGGVLFLIGFTYSTVRYGRVLHLTLLQWFSVFIILFFPIGPLAGIFLSFGLIYAKTVRALWTR